MAIEPEDRIGPLVSVVKWIAGIAAAVIAAVLVHYLTAERAPAPPEHPGLVSYDDLYGRFSLEYPAFLGGATMFSEGNRHGVRIGNWKWFHTSDFVDHIRAGKERSFMAVSLEPRPASLYGEDAPKALMQLVGRMLHTRESWLAAERVLSSRRRGLSFYIEKQLEIAIPFVEPLYSVEFLRIDGKMLVTGFALVIESEWQKYKSEIRRSFESIELRRVKAEPPRATATERD